MMRRAALSCVVVLVSRGGTNPGVLGGTGGNGTTSDSQPTATEAVRPKPAVDKGAGQVQEARPGSPAAALWVARERAAAECARARKGGTPSVSGEWLRPCPELKLVHSFRGSRC